MLKSGSCTSFLLLWALTAASVPAVADDCLICDRQVVLDQKLAACFLDRYEILRTSDAGVIAVDLSDCPELGNDTEEQDRGVVASLKMPENAEDKAPDPTFMITHGQMSCLKQRLADEALILDPAAEIALDDCQ